MKVNASLKRLQRGVCQQIWTPTMVIDSAVYLRKISDPAVSEAFNTF